MLDTLLSNLAIDATFTQFAKQTYIEISILLKDTIRDAQLDRWERMTEKDNSCAKRAYQCKAEWGLETALGFLPRTSVRTYLCIRNGAYTIPTTMDTFSCTHCQLPFNPATLDHTLWDCPHTQQHRTQLQADIQHISIAGHNYLLNRAANDKTHFVLGMGARHMTPRTWELAQNICVGFIDNTCRHLVHDTSS